MSVIIISKKDNGTLTLKGNKLSNKIYLTQKLTGKRLYGEAPEYLPIKLIDESKGYIIIPNKSRKYGSNFEIKGLSPDDQIQFDTSVTKINKFQFQFDQHMSNKKYFIAQTAFNKFQILGDSFEDSDKVIARRRIFLDSADEYDTLNYEIPVLKKEFIIDFIDLVKTMSLTDRDIVDFFILNKSGQYHLIHIDSLESNWKSDGSNLKHIMYQTRVNSFAMRFAADIRRYISTINITDESIHIFLKKTNTEISDLLDVKFVEFNKAGTRETNGHLLRKTIKNNELCLDTNEFVNILSTGRNSYNGYVTFYEEGSVIRSVLRTMDNVDKKALSKQLTLDYEKNKLEEAILKFQLKFNKQAIKIAVLGSSHTRPMFTSKNYYNPEYKKYFSVVYTQFHSSIISLVSDKSIRFDEHFYPNRPQTSLDYIRTDMEKTFWDKLKRSDADYFLFDIYIDIQMGIFKFNDGHVISYNSYQAESDFIASNVQLGVELSTIQNDSEYYNQFTKALEIFRKKILEIFLENKIIIHLFDMNESYKGTDGMIKKYDQKMSSIDRLNYDATRMQQLVSNIFPQAKILDTRGGRWIGYEDMPLGNMPHHYESGYYKNMMDLLIKLIIN